MVFHTQTNAKQSSREACIGGGVSPEQDVWVHVWRLKKAVMEDRMAELGVEGETGIYQVNKGETSFPSREIKEV